MDSDSESRAQLKAALQASFEVRAHPGLSTSVDQPVSG